MFEEVCEVCRRKEKFYMIKDLKEKTTHGTKQYPYEQYNIQNRKFLFHVPVHWHDEMEIIVIEKGELDVKIGDDTFLGKPGDIFIVNPRELHLMGQSQINGLYYTLLFPIEFISFQTPDDLETELFAPLRSSKLLFPHYLNSGIKQKVSPYINEIIKANITKNNKGANEISLAKHHLRTRILLLEIIQCLYEENAFIKPESIGDINMQKEMLAFIQAHCLEKISLSTLSLEFHLSEKYISRYFVEHFKIPFSNYVIHLRLTHARQQLETTNDSITDIALQSGFANVSYFIRAFKAMYGVSPLKYRKGL